MPELPEVETIRLQLEKAIVGLRITDIEVLREKSFIGDRGEVRGQRVVGVRRRAKVQFIELENGVCLAIHLKMTGQLIWRKPNQESRIKNKELSNDESRIKNKESRTNIYDTSELPNKYTRVVISFSNGAKLFFNDLRVFGWIKVVQSSKFKVQSDSSKFKINDLGLDKYGPEANKNQKSKIKNQNQDDFLGLDKYGPEAIDESTFTLEYFQNMLSKTSRAVKLAILDQEKLAGVGNIYANEALFRSGILPTKEGKKLRNGEMEKLRNEIIKVLREAIEHGGTSDKDEAFRQIDGSKGGYQKYLKVYNREGEACSRCGKPILKIKIGGRGTYYCPNCQK